MIGAAPGATRQGWRLADGAALAAALLATIVVWAPLAGCYFYSDDFLNLYQIANFAPLRYLLTPNGGHLLLSRNAVFYVSHALFGVDPVPYYASAVALHVLNVGILFALVRRFTGRSGIACFAAVLWGTSPLHEGTLGWYAVFGQVIATATTLCILLRAALLRERGEWPSRNETRVWYALALIGATSFGTGLALALALPIALWWLLPRNVPGARRTPPLISLVVVVPLLYFALLRAYQAAAGGRAEAQMPSVAMLSDFGAIALVLARLLAMGSSRLLLGFWHDVVPDPSWTWVLLASTAALLAAALASSERNRRYLVAFAILAVACYGSIAAARATMLLAFPVDTIPRIARYHYVGQLFLVLVLAAVLTPLCRAIPARLRGFLLAAWLVATAVSYATLAPPLDLHRDARATTQQTLRALRAAARAQPPGGDVYIPNRFFRPMPLPGPLFPGRAALFTIFFPTNRIDGRRVFFVEKNAATVTAAKQGRRTADLLVLPSAVPADHRH